MTLDAYIADVPPARLSWVRTASGHWTARRRGRLLASTIHPVREARAVAALQTVPWLHRLVIVVGHGLGYHVAACVHRCRYSRVIVFEPDPGLVVASLDRGTVTRDDLRRVVFYRNAADLLDSGATWYHDLVCGAALVMMPAACPAWRHVRAILRAIYDVARAAELDLNTLARDEPWHNALSRLNGCVRNRR